MSRNNWFSRFWIECIGRYYKKLDLILFALLDC